MRVYHHLIFPRKNLQKNTLSGREVTGFDTDALPIRAGAEVREDISGCLEDESTILQETAAYDRKLELLIACYKKIEPRISSLLEKIPEGRKGIVFGGGVDMIDFNDLYHMMRNSTGNTSPLIGVLLENNKRAGRINSVYNRTNVPALYLSNKLKCGAFQKNILTACSASTQAIAFGVDAIRKNRADIVLAGGSDSTINLNAFIGFMKLGIIQPDDRPAEKVCRPLDVNRKGTMLGEGAGLLLLASEKIVNEMGLSPKLEIIGSGNTLDGYKITAPHPEGRGMKRAMQRALTDAGVKPENIDYINLHGTGTITNDQIELESIIEVFGDAAAGVMVSSTKDRHGHQIAAAGIQELIILCLAMENNFVPCTVNLEKPVISNSIDIVMTENRRAPLKICISNSFAFGGINTVLVVKKV